MAVKHGKDGEVAVGAVVIGKVRSWSLDIEQATADASACGEDWDTHTLGRKNWKGGLEVVLDDADAGQQALAAGESVTLNLYEGGNTAGLKQYSGTSTITSQGVKISHTENVTASFNFMGNGALASAVIA